MRPALPACACSGSVTRVQAAFHHTATTLVVMCFVLPCLLRMAQGAATQVHTAVHAMVSDECSHTSCPCSLPVLPSAEYRTVGGVAGPLVVVNTVKVRTCMGCCAGRIRHIGWADAKDRVLPSHGIACALCPAALFWPADTSCRLLWAPFVCLKRACQPCQHPPAAFPLLEA